MGSYGRSPLQEREPTACMMWATFLDGDIGITADEAPELYRLGYWMHVIELMMLLIILSSSLWGHILIKYSSLLPTWKSTSCLIRELT